MSWTDVFPIFTDEQADRYRVHVKSADASMIRGWFTVKRVIRPRVGRHLVSASLYWERPCGVDGARVPVTKRMMRQARKLGLATRYDPWDHYVQPLLEGAAALREARPDVVFRVYLAADLEFLVKDLVKAGCEVMLMETSSDGHNPGALWRFLALEERDRWVTVTDSDLARDILNSVERTELIMKSGLGLWRVPYIFGSVQNDNHPGYYRPINASQWGAIGGHPVRLLLEAFLWHSLMGTMPDECVIGSRNARNSRVGIYGTRWPMYGFDEWFLLAALFPRMAASGVLTLLPINQREVNHWFSLDIEYVTWANPKSEILYFGKSDLLKRKRKEKEVPKSKPPSSPVLDRMVAEKNGERASLVIPFPHQRSRSALTLVVARYHEDVRWLVQVPKGVEIVMYNKGAEIPDKRILKRVDHLVPLPNQGRESDTYLHHIQHFVHGPNDGWTAFCQGDPFPHSPDFLKLLERRDDWSEVQALTSGYNEAHDVPPRHARILDDGEWIAGLPVRTELCSAHTLDILSWRDEIGGGFFKDYREHYSIPRGWSISGYFLESCGLHGLAEQAWRAALAQFAYGAMFAVRNERLTMIPKKCIPRMRKLACGHYTNGYVFERLWLHFFGLPFITAQRGMVLDKKFPTCARP